MPSTETPHVVVIGGGLTGLATAFLLTRAERPPRVTLLERDDRPGGKARTTVRDGYTVDWGPNGFLTNVRDTFDLALQVGLADALQPASEAARRRYLYRDGGLRPLPGTPPAFLASELVSWPGKLRAAAEVVLGGRREGEESVHAFLSRHFGRALADALAGAMVAGITAGDPFELSVDALFPRLRAMEREHGSLVRALLAGQRAARAARAARDASDTRDAAAGATSAHPDAAARPSGRLTSFREGGVERLITALADALGPRVRTGSGADALARRPDGALDVRLRGGEALRADAVVVTTPTPAAAGLLEPLSADVAEALRGIPYAGVRVFGLGFDRIDVPRTLDGFGFLVPRDQGVRSLGVLWTSTLYPDRAPAGKVLLRVLAGGRPDPGMLELSDDEALGAVRRDLERSMGIVADPEFVELRRWPEAIPQYTLGHLDRVRAAETGLASVPGVVLAGNAYRGVGLNDCVRDARRAVERVVGLLEPGGPGPSTG